MDEVERVRRVLQQPVGRPIPGTAVRINGDGEVLLKGDHVFLGYYHNESATAERARIARPEIVFGNLHSIAYLCAQPTWGVLTCLCGSGTLESVRD